MKNKIFKQFIIIIILVTCIVGVYSFPKLFIKQNGDLPEVKLKDIKSNKSFAIMVQNSDGYEEYSSDDNRWPGADYVFKEAKCTDNNGNAVENAVTFADGKATLTTNQTIYCTLYFDEKPKSTINILREKDPSGNLSTDLQGGMYRYQGTEDIPNWICFGTRDADTCKSDPDGIDKYMYRIIGITEEGQMYLVKETLIKEGSVTDFSWNDKYYTSGSYAYTCENKICPEWGQNNLFKRLNGTSNGTIQGTGSYIDKADTDIFVDSSEYEYLKSGDSNGGSASDWYNLIADHEWMYGDFHEYNTTNSYNGNYMYQVETGKSKTKHYVQQPVGSATVVEEQYIWPNTNKLKAKISLMYIHDYIYSYFDGLIEESRGNPQNKDIAKNSWLFFQKDGYNISPAYEWLSTRLGVGSTSGIDVRALRVGYGGDLYSHSLPTVNGVRPVFYLESKAKIVDGDGTQKNPYILSVY